MAMMITGYEAENLGKGMGEYGAWIMAALDGEPRSF